MKNFLRNFVEITKTKIIELANSELTNLDKKTELDEKVTNWVMRAMDTLPINFIFKFIIKKYFVSNISLITQMIYDLLKAKINGVTKEVQEF